MSTYKIRMSSPEQTTHFAKAFGELLEAGDLITLEGDLGAGKTHFSKGVALGLGVQKVVNSPTYTIIKEYEGRIPLYHMDVYRVEEEEEELGLEEYFGGDGVSIVEWASKISSQLPRERLDITIRHGGENERYLLLEPRGERYEQLCKELAEWE